MARVGEGFIPPGSVTAVTMFHGRDESLPYEQNKTANTKAAVHLWHSGF